MYNVKCTMCNVQCAMYNVHCFPCVQSRGVCTGLTVLYIILYYETFNISMKHKPHHSGQCSAELTVVPGNSVCATLVCLSKSVPVRPYPAAVSLKLLPFFNVKRVSKYVKFVVATDTTLPGSQPLK